MPRVSGVMGLRAKWCEWYLNFQGQFPDPQRTLEDTFFFKKNANCSYWRGVNVPCHSVHETISTKYTTQMVYTKDGFPHTSLGYHLTLYRWQANIGEEFNDKLSSLDCWDWAGPRGKDICTYLGRPPGLGGEIFENIGARCVSSVLSLILYGDPCQS